MVVADRERGSPPGARQALLEERRGGLAIPVLLEEDVDHLAVLVHHAIQGVLVPAPEEEHLVDVAPGAQRAAMLADLGGEQGVERLDPA
jgi:hypothetical protein